MSTPRPRLLDAADQRLSDQVARACAAAGRELRDAAHHRAAKVAADWRPFYYAAYLALEAEGELYATDFDTQLERLAERLERIQERHTDAADALKEAG